MGKNKVYNLLILDASGSMNSIIDATISGFNEIVQTVKGVAKDFPEQEHYISFISFNSRAITTHLDCEHVDKINEIDKKGYIPNASTPLFDAMGNAINDLRAKLKDESNYNVLVTIFTDGLENASKEYTREVIKGLVEQLENENWTFTYIGADHDVSKFTASISITNTLTFQKNATDMKRMFERESRSRRAYNMKIRQGKDTKKGYFSEGDSESEQ